jgi:beta-phosphoglucomutase-like phosphatase (HAD superfamily)
MPGKRNGPVARPGDERAFDAVVFDFDGVIVDTENVIHSTWAETFDHYGASFSAEEWAINVGTYGAFDLFAAIAARSTVPLPGVAELERQVLERELELLKDLVPFPGVCEWIESAARLGMVIAIASSSPAPWVDALLKNVGLTSHFSVVSCRSETLAAKPAPDVYLDACRRLGVEPARAIAVEDSTNGLTAALAAGLACVAVPNSITRDHDLKAANLIIESLGALPLEEAVQLLSKRATG